MYLITHKDKYYTVYLSSSMISLSAFSKNMISLREEKNCNATRIKGEISELQNFSKIGGGKHIYNSIMEHIKDIDNEKQ